MKFPKLRDYVRELVYGDATYEVVFASQAKLDEASLRAGLGRGNRGLCIQAEERIYILRGQSPRDRFETWLHEVAHLVEYESGIKIPHRLIEDLEGPFARFIAQNFF